MHNIHGDCIIATIFNLHNDFSNSTRSIMKSVQFEDNYILFKHYIIKVGYLKLRETSHALSNTLYFLEVLFLIFLSRAAGILHIILLE